MHGFTKKYCTILLLGDPSGGGVVQTFERRWVSVLLSVMFTNRVGAADSGVRLAGKENELSQKQPPSSLVEIAS